MTIELCCDHTVPSVWLSKPTQGGRAPPTAPLTPVLVKVSVIKSGTCEVFSTPPADSDP